MDINDARVIITLVSFLIFIGIVIWAWSSRQRDSFKDAANLPFIDDDKPPQSKSVANANNAASTKGHA